MNIFTFTFPTNFSNSCEVNSANLNFIFQIMLSDASRTLSTALNGKAYYKQVTVVVPTSWQNVKCNQEIHMPRSGSSYGVSV